MRRLLLFMIILSILLSSQVIAPSSSSSINWLTRNYADTIYCQIGGDCGTFNPDNWTLISVGNVHQVNMTLMNATIDERSGGNINGTDVYLGNVNITNNLDLNDGNITTTGRARLSYLDLLEIVEPDTPPTNTLRLYSEDKYGFSTHKFLDGTGLKAELTPYRTVMNVRGTTIAANRFVYITGNYNNVSTIDLAKADSISTMPSIGVTVETIPNGSFGRVLPVGLLEGIDVNGLLVGDILYISDTLAGTPRNTPPITPNLTQEVGVVLSKDGNDIGDIQIISRALTGDEFGTINNFTVAGDLTVLGSSNIISSVNGTDINVTGFRISGTNEMFFGEDATYPKLYYASQPEGHTLMLQTNFFWNNGAYRASGNISSYNDIFTYGAGDDFWGGNPSQADAFWEINSTGNAEFQVLLTDDISTRNINTSTAKITSSVEMQYVDIGVDNTLSNPTVPWYPIAIGFLNNITANSIAIGYTNDVSGVGVGYNIRTKAGGSGYMFGSSLNLHGLSNLAIGNNLNTSNTYSLAIGTSSLSTGENAITIGYNVSANSTNSIAIGSNSEANAEGAIAIGTGVINNNASSVKIGQNSVYIYENGNIDATGNISFDNLLDGESRMWSDGETWHLI